MRSKLSLLLGATVLSSAAACGSSPGNALEGKTPQGVLSAALSAASKFGGVHYVLETSGTVQKETVTGDARTNEGIQSVVTGSDQVVVESVGSTAFLRGNAGGLQNIIGLAAAPASQYADKWISLQRSDSLYQSVVRAVTLKSMLAQLEPLAPLVESMPGTLGGRHVIGVRGELPSHSGNGSATFWVSTSKPTVPVGVDAQSTNGGQTVTEIGAFSKWGERFSLPSLPSAVAFSTIPTK